METIFGIRKLQRKLTWPVVTLGMFDGVHLGHQKVIEKIVSLANKKNGESIVLTFDRHPRSFLSKKPQSCITSLEHRLVLFERLGVDITIVLKFDKKIAETSAEEFIAKIMYNSLGARVVVLGFNCLFGKDRRGNASMVCGFAHKYGFEVISCEPVEFEGETISSTTIRKNIIQGNLQKAKGMLGRHVSVFGTVIKGSGRGKELGFPTANLNLHHEVRPPSGVYATKVFFDGKEYNAITNIGKRPTFEENTHKDEPIVEVHIIDFNESIYGRDLEVQFLYKLREEAKFENVDELKLQLERDKMRLMNKSFKKVLTE
ncbi:MAG: bifunctional riboflavin kinase/FAD synthetase [Candidatus Scalinduaceae bacterium]